MTGINMREASTAQALIQGWDKEGAVAFQIATCLQRARDLPGMCVPGSSTQPTEGHVTEDWISSYEHGKN